MKFWITPSLALTDEPTMNVMTPDEATVWIQTGDDALVGSIEDAAQVLTNLGLSDDEITHKIDFALGIGN
jgi:hypothetical protein